MIRLLTVDHVKALHQRLIEQSGGSPGLRDHGALEAAVAQPRMSFAGEDLYCTLAEKVSALAFALVMNHPFIDGNKRVGHAALEVFLLLNGYELAAEVDEQEHLMLNLAAGRIKREELTQWIEAHMVAFRGE